MKTLKILKQTVLTIIYPFWFFFFKTLFGNMIIVPLIVASPMLIGMFFISDKGHSGESANDLGFGLAILNFILLILVGCLLMEAFYYLERNYICYGYKTEVKFKI